MSRISEIAKEMKTWWGNDGSDIEVQNALDEIIRLDEATDHEAEQTEHRDCINCESADDCAKCRGFTDESKSEEYEEPTIMTLHYGSDGKGGQVMKYISADYIKAVMKGDRLMQGNCEYELWKQEVDKKVDAMPSIDIVRCKECKHRNERCGMGERRWCEMLNMSTTPNDFCSYAERREP